ncbi:acidobacterial duplicated orphan permease [Hartmannibacter diazotrophicus]|uniref:Acidobacterial duplicated orphan permease n=1 Tax=Hartmannibacter diazotrophicus TaxID=1482074 RepID=A0A2C9D6T6_9HYPH|nr:ABC transporter permease [Hartmannibacter diazotrophicus]SON55461.1 acidobacterial duplicated orphan permease [Hartmannibacter diazotrophicus]
MIRFIAADLKRLWAGSLVVVLLVALATALGVAVTLQERGLRLGSARAAEPFDLVIGAPGSETQLVLSSVFLQAAPLPLMPGETLDTLKADPRVAWASPIGFGDNYNGYPVVGVTPDFLANMGTITEGTGFSKEFDAVAGALVGLEPGAEFHPMHGADAHGEAHATIDYHVVGRLSPLGSPWDRAILVPIEAVWAVHGLHHDDDANADQAAEAGSQPEAEHDEHGEPGVPAIVVKPKTIADAYKLRQDYRGNGTVAVFPAEVLTRLYATLGDARMILSLVAGGAQLLVAAAILLVSVVHVAQRRRQIGALRAFGAPRASVFGIVWIEIFLLVGLGVLAGLGIGYAAARMIANAFSSKSGIILPIEITVADLNAVGLLLVVCGAMALVPALLAYRQPPVAALRA